MKHVERQNFYETISALLNERLKQYMRSSLNRSTCTQIYVTIFQTLTEVLEQSNVKLSNETANLLAQAYYGCVAINESGQGLDPNIFDKVARIDNVPDVHELIMVAMLSEGTQLAIDAVAEIRRRS